MAKTDLTQNSYALLALLGKSDRVSAYELERHAESLLGDFWPLTHTTVYTELPRLERLGFVDSHQETNGRRRRFFSLNRQGRDALRLWAANAQSSPPRFRDEAFLKSFGSRDRIGMSERANELVGQYALIVARLVHDADI